MTSSTSSQQPGRFSPSCPSRSFAHAHSSSLWLLSRHLLLACIGLLCLGSHLLPALAGPALAQPTSLPPPTILRHQGNDSNCDYIAVANGVHNIGGDGEFAYHAARSLVPQVPRDFKEAYYTLLGPQGSDRPFSLNNLGAAPEAFIGMYETLGYNAVFLAATPDTVDLDFARAIRDRLAANPAHSFAHLWTTPRPYNPHARMFHVAETGEDVPLLYPYHEVAALAAPDPDQVIMLDGLVGHPYAISLADLAYQLRGFNRVIIVSHNAGSLHDHQRFQMNQAGQPYVAPRLGGLYLTAARTWWGSAYPTWGRSIGLPYKIHHGEQEKIILPGEYVHYERIDEWTVTQALLGVRMGHDLEHAGILPPDSLAFWEERALTGGIRAWVVATFGSLEQFEQAFGKTLTNEFWLSQQQMKDTVLHGLPHSLVDEGQQPGYICTLTERAMLAWNEQHGAFLVPLGRIYYEQLRAELAAKPQG